MYNKLKMFSACRFFDTKSSKLELMFSSWIRKDNSTYNRFLYLFLNRKLFFTEIVNLFNN